MTQFFAVSSDDSSITENILSQAANAAATFIGCQAAHSLTVGNCGLLLFPSIGKAARDNKPCQVAASATWSAGIGTWVERGQTQSDDEVLRRLAAGYGDIHALENELDRLDGEFCFLAGRDDGRALRVITDPLGRLHVYALQTENAILISTSALMLAHLGQCSWHQDAVREFLAGGVVYEDRSLFRGVRKLPPATIQTYESSRKVAENVYWSPYKQLDATATTDESLERYWRAVQSALADIHRRFESPVLDLTGGLDSRIILAGTRSFRSDSRIQTIVAGPADSADVAVAQHIAATLGLQHRHIASPAADSSARWQAAKKSLTLTDGEHDMLQYANILGVHQSLFPSFDVSVNGTAGELIRGYWWNLLFPRIGARSGIDSEYIAQKCFIDDPSTDSLLASSYPTPLATHFAGVIERTCQPLAGARNTTLLDSLYLSMLMQRWQGRLASATNRVWPALSPMLFREPVEIALHASVALRLNSRMARRLLARFDAQLAGLPTADGGPALPINLRTLPRFAPLGSQLAARLGQRVKRSLSKKIKRRNTSTAVKQAPLDILRLEEVADALNPEAMRTADLYQQPALQTVCSAIFNGQQPEPRIGRVLTLEQVARLREKAPRLSTRAFRD